MYSTTLDVRTYLIFLVKLNLDVRTYLILLGKLTFDVNKFMLPPVLFEGVPPVNG